MSGQQKVRSVVLEELPVIDVGHRPYDDRLFSVYKGVLIEWLNGIDIRVCEAVREIQDSLYDPLKLVMVAYSKGAISVTYFGGTIDDVPPSIRESLKIEGDVWYVNNLFI